MTPFFQKSSTKLLNVTTPVNSNQTGSAVRLAMTQIDDVPDSSQVFKAVFKINGSGGASSPTITGKIQTSLDGTNWIDVGSTSAVAADGTTAVAVLDPANSFLLPYVRAVTVLAGGTLPNHTVECELVSNAPFTVGT